jgi:hypothetical protein
MDITNFTVPFDIELLQKLEEGEDVLVHTQTFTPGEKPMPPPEETTPGVVMIYDSNINGNWGNGVFRKGKKDGNTDANGLGIYCAASGNPTIEIDGKGTCFLETEGGDDGVSHGRFYTAVCNYNGIFQTDFNMMTDTITSYTQKFRSRHQADNWEPGAKIPCEKRFGGIGNGFDTAAVDCKTEKCHNIHDNADKLSGKLPKRLKYDEWYTSRFTYQDINFQVGKEGELNTGIYQRSEIKYPGSEEFVTVVEGIHKHPLDFYLNKPLFMERSEKWDRINGFGKLAVRNQLLWAIEGKKAS